MYLKTQNFKLNSSENLKYKAEKRNGVQDCHKMVGQGK